MLSKPPSFKTLWRQYHIPFITLTLLSVVYFITRLSNLLIWPIFADEAIYVRWAQVMRAVPTLRFLPLTDGKQPLFMWLIIPFLKVIQDPLYAGRLVSVFAGWGSLIGLYILTAQLSTLLLPQASWITKLKTLFSSPSGLTSHPYSLPTLVALLYVLVPYTLFFDRFALSDSLLNMLGIWVLVFAFMNIKNPRLDVSIITGGLLGLAWLTKSPAVFFIILLPLTSIIILPQIFRNKWLFVRLTISWVVSITIAFGIYNILRLGPEFHQIGLRNQDYVYSFSEVLQHPATPIVSNLQEVFGFYWHLFTPPLLAFALIGTYLLFKKHPFLAIYLLLWTLGPIVGQSLIAKTVTARYYLFTITPWLIFASIGVIYSQKYFKDKLVLATISIMALIFLDFLIIHRPQQAWLPRIERSGYLEEWTAGHGMQEIASYIEEQAQEQTVVVGTEGYFGTTPDGLQIYFNSHPNVTILGNSHILDHVPESLYQSLDQNLVFLVINNERFMVSDPRALGLRLINTFPKATRPDGTQQEFQFYQLIERPTE